MADKNDDVLQDLLDPKKLLEQLRECETKQFKNAIDLLQECEERAEAHKLARRPAELLVERVHDDHGQTA